MSKPNNENQNTLMSWATGYFVIYAIGIAAGAFIHESGILQKVTSKIFDKTKKREWVKLLSYDLYKKNMNEINNILQEILTEKPQSKILAWKSQTIPNAFILKQEGKRYLGLLRKDKNDQDYWKYLPLKDKGTSQSNNEQVSNPSSVEKFNQRQESTKNHANNSNAS